MEFKHLLMAVCLVATGSANAATVWLPTNVDTNYLAFQSVASGASLAIFNYDNNTNSIYLPQRLDVDVNTTGAGTVTFQSNANHTATSGSNSLNLGTDGNYFAVGMSMDSGATWTLDNGSPTHLNGSIYTLFFDLPGGTQTAIQVDADPYDTGGVPPEAVVPVPAAAWLFGSGLLGLAGIARRKRR